MHISKMRDTLNIGNLKGFREPIEILLAAINDWPQEISDLTEFVNIIENFINGETSRANIENTLSRIDVKKYAWQAESLSVLVEVFDHFEQNTTLDEIISRIESSLTDYLAN